jgi:uncharacterized BrkB/YihY/UPF0761 family membrane protein
MRHLSRWRTIIAGLALAVLLLVGFWIGSNAADSKIAIVSGMFGSFATAVMGIAIALCGKSLGEHLGNGSGVGGAMAALFTRAKPGDPPQTTVTQSTESSTVSTTTGTP